MAHLHSPELDECKALQSPAFRAKYEVLRFVGKGSFGEALLVRCTSTGMQRIAKVIECATMHAKEKRSAENEIRILSTINHPNIVHYVEHFEDGDLIVIVMEYAEGGDLGLRIKEAKRTNAVLAPQTVMAWLLQMCMALKYLHDHHILHRDLKPANVFLTAKDVVVLGDFGISTVLHSTMACANTMCGTPYYCSPELCQRKPYNNKSDVWSLGVIFYELLTLSRPFTANTANSIMHKIVEGQYAPLPDTIPAPMRTLAYSLLSRHPAMRPSINQILESEFVQDTLRRFSTELEAQAQRDEQELEATCSGEQARPLLQEVKPLPVAPPVAQLSDKEQMAVLRGMRRDGVRSMLTQHSAQPTNAPPETAAVSPLAQHVGSARTHIAHTRAMVQHSKAIIGAKLKGPDTFGDGGTSGRCCTIS